MITSVWHNLSDELATKIVISKKKKNLTDWDDYII